MAAVTHVIVAVVAWLIGLGVYVLALEVAWQQHMSWLSLLSLAQSSAIAWAFAYPCVYIPVLRRVAPAVARPVRFILLPLVAAPLGLVAVTLVWLSDAVWAVLLGFGWDWSAIAFFTSPEASLFYWFFGVASLVVGLAFAPVQRAKAV